MRVRFASPAGIGACVFGIASAIRTVILILWPDMYWHDGFHRLAYADELVQGGTWLPLYQSTLGLLAVVTREPFWFRFLTSLYGAWAAAAGAVFAFGLHGRMGAWFVGLFLTFCPLFLFESSGLFQEPLFNALVLTAACCLQRPTRFARLLALVCLFLAAWTRYEGWLVNAVACSWLLLHPRAAKLWQTRLLSIAWLALPELIWMAWHHGLSPMGAQSLAPSLTLDRFFEFGVIWGKLLFQWTGLLALLMLFLGAYAFSRSLWRQRTNLKILGGEQAWLMVFGAVLFLNFLLLAIAHPFVPIDNARGANLLVLAMPFFVLHSLNQIHKLATRLPAFLLPAVVLFGLFLSSSHPLSLRRILARSPTEELTRLSVETQKLLAGHVSQIDHLLVIGEGFPSWPQIRTNETLSTIVGLRIHHGRVIGDYRLDPKLSGKQAIWDWLTREKVSHVLITKGWQPWRPVHDWAFSEARSGEYLHLLEEGETFRFFQLRLGEPP